jgi:acetyl esterase/lipase
MVGPPPPAVSQPASLEALRRAFDDVDAKVLPDGLRESDADGAPVPCRWLWVGERDEAAGLIVYVHGGGFVAGSARSHRHIGAHLAEAASAAVLMVDYRLAPEHQFPAGRDDVVDVYRWLLAEGRSPSSIAFAGDSAGAGLVLTALLHLRAGDVPLPAAVALFSPWVDLTLSGTSAVTHAAFDPMVGRAGLLLFARAYLGTTDPLDVRVAPLVAGLEGLPECLVQVGEREVLLDDAIRLTDRLRASGGRPVLECWPGMTHVWHALAPELAEASAAIHRAGAWLAERGISAPAGSG